MASEPLSLVCPKCGSDDVASVDTLIGHATGRVIEDRETMLRSFDASGSTEVDWNTAESIGLSCRNCPWQAEGDSMWAKLKFAPAERVCPGCGGPKQPHPELCAKCRKRRRGDPQARPQQIVDEKLAAAYARWMGGETMIGLAEELHDLVPHVTAQQLADQLRNEFRRRGWPERAEATR